MAQKLKKSKQKPRSQRSIEMEQERLAAIEEYEKMEGARKRKAANMGRMMLSYYSAAMAILSLLVDYMGIIGIVAVVLGVLGIRQIKNRRSTEFCAAAAGIALGAVSLIIQVYRLILYLNA